ncbi:MAG: pseudouridine synthase [Xanthomonadales bacterium]|nr:pseudouridine synthase [Xanthomonadales bacterium]
MTAPNRTLLTLKRDSRASESQALEERLHKVLANAGLGSRRMLETRIEAGEVRLNGSPAVIGASVHVGDRVEMDDRQFVVASDNRSDAEVIAYNKPEGVITTRDDPEGRPTIFEQLPRIKGARWVAVGRLDVNTTGLLLLTTDGELANALMHPRNSIEREYLCRVHGEVPDTAIEQLRTGIQLEDGPAHFDEIAVISRGASHSWFRVVLREGRNREVRRMWDAQGCLVSRLKRIRYGSVELPRQLKRGQSENLDDSTTKALRKLAGLGDPTPTLTLKQVLHQRRASRGVTEVKVNDKTTANAWTGAYHNEARELTAYDRIRPESTGRRGKPGPRRSGKEVNGNLIRPERAPKRSNSRRVAPGQELPSVRTWFAGDERPASGAQPGRRNAKPGGKPGARPAGGGNRNAPGGNRNAAGGNRNAPGGNRNASAGNRNATGKPSGNRPRGGNSGNRAPGRSGPSHGPRK